MIVLAAVIVCLFALFGWAGYLSSTDRLLRDRRKRRVLVELQTGDTFQGVLLACDGRSLTLGSVSVVAGQDVKPVDGDLLIPRGDVKFIQRP